LDTRSKPGANNVLVTVPGLRCRCRPALCPRVFGSCAWPPVPLQVRPPVVRLFGAAPSHGACPTSQVALVSSIALMISAGPILDRLKPMTCLANDGGMPVVTFHDGVAMADSDVAEFFGKRHAEVLRAIKDLCSGDFRRRNFASSEINGLTGTSSSHVMMTKGGGHSAVGRGGISSASLTAHPPATHPASPGRCPAPAAALAHRWYPAMRATPGDRDGRYRSSAA
jgi:hypothetical protein